ARSAAAQSAVFPDTTPRAPCSHVCDMKSEAMASDVESIDAIITATYDVISGPAGKKRDWDRMRPLFFPGSRLIPTAQQADRDDLLAAREFCRSGSSKISQVKLNWSAEKTSQQDPLSF